MSDAKKVDSLPLSAYCYHGLARQYCEFCKPARPADGAATTTPPSEAETPSDTARLEKLFLRFDERPQYFTSDEAFLLKQVTRLRAALAEATAELEASKEAEQRTWREYDGLRLNMVAAADEAVELKRQLAEATAEATAQADAARRTLDAFEMFSHGHTAEVVISRLPNLFDVLRASRPNEETQVPLDAEWHYSRNDPEDE